MKKLKFAKPAKTHAETCHYLGDFKPPEIKTLSCIFPLVIFSSPVQIPYEHSAN